MRFMNRNAVYSGLSYDALEDRAYDRRQTTLALVAGAFTGLAVGTEAMDIHLASQPSTVGRSAVRASLRLAAVGSAYVAAVSTKRLIEGA